MANPFTKAWRYLMALFSSKVDEYADPKVQIQQASVQMAGHSRLEQIRASMRGEALPTGGSGTAAPATPASSAPEAEPETPFSQ